MAIKEEGPITAWARRVCRSWMGCTGRARITTLLLPTPQQAHQTNSTASPAPSHTHNHFVHRTRAIIITLPCPPFASRSPPTPSSPLHTSIPSQPARPLQPAVAPSHALSSTHHRRDRNSFLDPIQVSLPLRASPLPAHRTLAAHKHTYPYSNITIYISSARPS